MCLPRWRWLAVALLCGCVAASPAHARPARHTRPAHPARPAHKLWYWILVSVTATADENSHAPLSPGTAWETQHLFSNWQGRSRTAVILTAVPSGYDTFGASMVGKLTSAEKDHAAGSTGTAHDCTATWKLKLNDTPEMDGGFGQSLGDGLRLSIAYGGPEDPLTGPVQNDCGGEPTNGTGACTKIPSCVLTGDPMTWPGDFGIHPDRITRRLAFRVPPRSFGDSFSVVRKVSDDDPETAGSWSIDWNVAFVFHLDFFVCPHHGRDVKGCEVST
jgi:hypothetical protein